MVLWQNFAAALKTVNIKKSRKRSQQALHAVILSDFDQLDFFMAQVVTTLPPQPAFELAEPLDASLEIPSATTALITTTAEDGLVTINTEGKKVRRVLKKKKRPARPQVDPKTFTVEPPPQTGTM